MTRAALEVLLDVRHPLAYLALQPTLELARSLGLCVDWLPLEVPALKPPGAPAPDDDRGIRHRRYRAQAIARELETYAAVQSLVLREPYRDGDAGAVNLGWLWLRERRPDALPDYLTRVFRAYWAQELDAASAQEAARCVAAVGGDAGAFLAWCEHEGAAAASQLASALRERGLFQVPAFVVADEVFYGRQHLPMIRWILAGRSGPAPI